MIPLVIENRIKEIFREIFNRANLGVVERYFSADCQSFELNSGEIGDRENLKGYLARLQDIFPDCEVEIVDMRIEFDKAVVRFSFKGIHLFEFLGISPSDREVCFNGVFIALLEENLIRKLLVSWDREALQREHNREFI